MGFFSTLGNIAGGLFGDPGLGDQIGGLFGGGDDGGSSNVANRATNLSGVLGGAAGGLANQRSQQAQLATALSGARQNQYQDALYQALLKQLQAPQAGADMARRGDLMANVQDVKANFTPGQGYSFTGGLRPSALGPNARAAGAALSNQGLNIAQGGLNLPATPDLTQGFPSPAPGGFLDALNAGAAGSGTLGAVLGGQSSLQQMLNQLLQQGRQQSGQVAGVNDPSDILGGLFDQSGTEYS